MAIVSTPTTRNANWVDKSSFAYKQMLKMGWSENTGLGSIGQGDQNPLRAVRTAEGAGVGLDDVREAFGAGGVSVHVRGLDNVYGGLQAIGEKRRKRKVDSNGDADDADDDADEEAEVGESDKKDKKNKKSKKSEQQKDSGVVVYTSPRLTMTGRTKHMDSKNIRNKSVSDMNAIFGVKTDSGVDGGAVVDWGIWGSGTVKGKDDKKEKKAKKEKKEKKEKREKKEKK